MFESTPFAHTETSAPSSSRSSGGSASAGNGGKKKKGAPMFLKAIKRLAPCTFGLLGGLLLFRSFGIYQDAFRRLFGGMGEGVCGWFGAIPFVGGIVSQGCNWVYLIALILVPLITLALLTTLQAAPTLLYFHGQSIAQMVAQMRDKQKGSGELNHAAGDTDEVKFLVDRHNSLNKTALKALVIVGAIAFIAEGVIVWYARNGRADWGTILIDTLGFDILLVSYLVLNNILTTQAATKARQYGEA
jgi:hypothetical protein